MSNVVSMERPQAYWISRAGKHRLAGRYDEAMALLSRAREQFGRNEEIEMELARVYDEMGCEEEAARAYLRVMRMGGRHTAQVVPSGAFKRAACRSQARCLLFRAL